MFNRTKILERIPIAKGICISLLIMESVALASSALIPYPFLGDVRFPLFVLGGMVLPLSSIGCALFGYYFAKRYFFLLVISINLVLLAFTIYFFYTLTEALVNIQ